MPKRINQAAAAFQKALLFARGPDRRRLVADPPVTGIRTPKDTET
jgi:hypothetical protein